MIDKYFKRLLFFLLAISSFFAVEAAGVGFYNVNNIFGISMREANSVCSDDEGFIWASSKTGILRLTNDEYRIYQLPYLTANIISVRLTYVDNKLIAFSNNGQIFIYNKIYDRFELLIAINEELNTNFLSLSSVVFDPKKDIFWFASSRGLYNYQDQQLSIIDFENQDVIRIIWLNDYQLILATIDKIYLFDTHSLEKTILVENKDHNFFQVSKLFLDESMNRLWVGSMSNGLFYYDFNESYFKSISIRNFPKQPILAIEEITDSTLWIGIDGQGIWEINKAGANVTNIYKENIDDPFSIKGNGVYDIYCEKNKRVWVTTYSGGVSYYDLASPIIAHVTHTANNPNSLVNNDVNCVIEDKEGKLWFATNNGISRWDIEMNKWTNFYVNKQEQAQVFLTLCEDTQGKIWAGTYSSGVYVLDGKTGNQLQHYSESVSGTPFVNDFVFDIYKDSVGDVWIGGINSQVVCYQHNENLFRKYASQPLNVFAEFSKKNMLFGCTYGLCILDNEGGSVSTLVSKILVNDILVKEGIIWVATSGNGLIRFDPDDESIEKFTTENGLPSNFANSVESSDGYIWLGTETGLCRFDPIHKTTIIYSSIRALSSFSFNRNAHCKLKNGNLAWGTNNGVVIFNPNIIEQEQSSGKIFLQDISIMGRSVRDLDFNLNEPLNELDRIEIKYNQNNIALELLPIGIASGSKFSWKLDGLDEEWTPPSNNRIVGYTNIPSKEYTLKLRLYDNSLSSIVAERSFIIQVTPPFWATYWFLIIVFIIVSTVIYSAFWYYINSLKQKHTEEKVRFFTNTAHDLRTSLTLIKAPIEELSKESNLSVTGRNFINLATEQASRLASVVTQLMDFQKVDIGKAQLSLAMVNLVQLIENRIHMFESIARNRDVQLSFNCNQENYYAAIDETMIEKVIDNLISNAVKYSHPHGVVYIELNCSESKWILEVKDAGIGISSKAQKQLFKEFYRGENAINSKIVGSGIGLLLVKNYVSLHNGEVQLTSQEDVGSTFQITIPFKEVAMASSVEPIEMKTKLYSEQNNNLLDANDVDGEEVTENKLRILIVEDNDDLRNFMQSAFSTEYEVYTAEDGVKAWDLIQNQLPDMVISDVMMPNMDGFELCQLAKSTYETSHIPIVLLTALSEKTEQLHGLGLGADDYLTKPFDLILLQQKIRSIIQNRKAVRETTLQLNKGNINRQILNNQHNDHFIKKMMEVVQANIANADFKKNEFASAMNVSASLLYKKVKSLTDQSPTDFIKTVRLDRALELLESGKYNVTEVGELVGYTSVSYFSTVFKKHFGKSPTEI